MSIVLRIRALEAPPGRLKRFVPRFKGSESERRKLSIAADIYEWMHASTASRRENDMLAQARANCRDFVIGHEIDDCDFMKRVQDKRVNPPTFRAGIWALGIRFDPQHRLFGCFALRDWFVVLTKQSRAVLDQGDNRWHEQIIECERIWSELFPQHVPVVSEDIYDYISDKVEKCDDRW